MSSPTGGPPPEQIAAHLIDAASQAPSEHNTQPWPGPERAGAAGGVTVTVGEHGPRPS